MIDNNIEQLQQQWHEENNYKQALNQQAKALKKDIRLSFNAQQKAVLKERLTIIETNRKHVEEHLQYLKTELGHNTPPLPKKQLADLPIPLNIISEHGPLPVGSRMDLPHNPFFVGREPILKQIAHSLSNGQITAITGSSGIGKTQLATQFVYCYGRYFAGGVFWLNFSQSVLIEMEIATCGNTHHLYLAPNFDDLPILNQVELVLRSWQNSLPCLIVFDNCEDQTLLNWKPSSDKCRILIISRLSAWETESGVQSFALDVLPRSKSIELLQKHHPSLSQTEADSIAATLNDLPLSLYLAASYLWNYQHLPIGQVDNYLADLETVSLPSFSLNASGEKITQAQKHLFRALSLTLERLNYKKQVDDNTKRDALAYQLFTYATYFAPNQPISTDLLKATLNAPIDINLKTAFLLVLKVLWNKLKPSPEAEIPDDLIKDALNRLVQLGLLTRRNGKGILQIHALLAFLGQHLAPKTAQQEVERTVLKAFENEMDETGYIKNTAFTILPHLQFITDVAQTRIDKQAGLLCNQLGYYLNQLQLYQSARPYFVQAATIRETVLGQKNLATATSLDNAGTLLQTIGDYDAALPYHERALAAFEFASGKNHLNTAQTLKKLGVLFHNKGQFETALPYYKRALAIFETALGEEHQNIASTLDNIGFVLQSMGDYEAAQSYFERALAINKQLFGENHPNTATSLGNIGVLLKHKGDYKTAQPYYEQSLQIFKNTVGKKHPDTAISLNDMGELLRSMGQYKAAQPYFKQALAIFESTLGKNHPNTATCLNNLGASYKTMGQYKVARPYFEQALAIFETVSGENHPDTAAALNNLGELLLSTKQYKTALPYFKRALAICEATLGDEHPTTQVVQQNLNKVLNKN